MSSMKSLVSTRAQRSLLRRSNDSWSSTMRAAPSAALDPKGRDKGQATEQSAYDVFRFDGMPGRYHLVREEDGELRPKKDRYSNLSDALQYLCLALGEGRRMVGLTPQNEAKAIRVFTHRKTM